MFAIPYRAAEALLEEIEEAIAAAADGSPFGPIGEKVAVAALAARFVQYLPAGRRAEAASAAVRSSGHRVSSRALH